MTFLISKPVRIAAGLADSDYRIKLGMVNQANFPRRRTAILAMMFSQFGRSPELTRLVILLLVWGHIRSRQGYTTLEDSGIRKVPRRRRGLRRKSFSLKRPRQRFL
jgi:hypothetical protein